MTLKQQVIADALTANPTMPTHTLARLVFRENYPLWLSPDRVRDGIRLARKGKTHGERFINQPVRSHPGGQPLTPHGKRAIALCADAPNTTTAALARILAREFRLPPERARSMIRSHRRKLNRKQ